MKKILITGKNSYIGSNFKKWVERWPNDYSITVIDLKSDEWRKVSFKSYDVVYHVAAIVHVEENDINNYYRVNRDLTVEVARKAQKDGVRQFIFLSTMGVYGKETGMINEKVLPNPKTPYAKSKLEAENYLMELSIESFKVLILRPPLVYGKECPGNYPKLVNAVNKVAFFPNVKNNRSMIFINNLSEFVKNAVDNELSGLCFPQNKEYINTTELVKLVANVRGEKLRIINGFSLFINLGIRISETLGKVFGSLVYDMNMPGGPNKMVYETCTFEESIELTER